MWMAIQGDTKNSFGCGPNGPMDCSVGTTPGEHWIRRPNVQRKEGQKLRVNVAKGSNLQMTMQVRCLCLLLCCVVCCCAAWCAAYSYRTPNHID